VGTVFIVLSLVPRNMGAVEWGLLLLFVIGPTILFPIWVYFLMLSVGGLPP
jgi:hypothetical protein